MENTVKALEENPDRKNIMEVWKGFTIEDVIIVTEKALKAIKPETINSSWRKLWPYVIYGFTGLAAEQIKEIRKETVDLAKKKKKKWRCGGKEFQGMDLGKIQELIDTTQE